MGNWVVQNNTNDYLIVLGSDVQNGSNKTEALGENPVLACSTIWNLPSLVHEPASLAIASIVASLILTLIRFPVINPLNHIFKVPFTTEGIFTGSRDYDRILLGSERDLILSTTDIILISFPQHQFDQCF